MQRNSTRPGPTRPFVIFACLLAVWDGTFLVLLKWQSPVPFSCQIHQSPLSVERARSLATHAGCEKDNDKISRLKCTK